MQAKDWWKNFDLGIELNISGTFIYNGIKAFHELDSFEYPIDSFEVLYNLSVGIERLLKVVIILIEHDEYTDLKSLEESLISHDTLALANRVNSRENLNLSEIHRSFLALLSDFYKTYRYRRYSLEACSEKNEEQNLLLSFVRKHLEILTELETSTENELFPVSNSDQTRQFLGRVVKKICDSLFEIASSRANDLHVYTTEIRSDSKAMKVFYDEQLDFIEEDIQKKELILFLMHQKSYGIDDNLLSLFTPLDLDAGLIPEYIQALLRDTTLRQYKEDIDHAYQVVDSIKERIKLMNLFGQYIDQYIDPYDDEDYGISFYDGIDS